MRRSLSLQLVLLFLAIASLSFGQVGNGTITGTVTDPANAVVPERRWKPKTHRREWLTPRYPPTPGTIRSPDLPVGTYSVTAKVQGFKTYTHTNLALAATQVLREDIVCK